MTAGNSNLVVLYCRVRLGHAFRVGAFGANFSRVMSELPEHESKRKAPQR